MTGDIRQLSIRKLLTEDVYYIIPMYQRNFAWGEGEITQLIQDVIDYLPSDQDYYIGSLVVAERHNGGHKVFETIDGQQRLTTLSLLASFLKNWLDAGLPWYDEPRIHFECRTHSTRTFEAIFKDQFKIDPSGGLREQDINTDILTGYRLIAKVLPLKLRESKINNKKFAIYLFRHVQIMRVRVPYDTDLNHYFEILNNRGEQLEKHEVLKARMLEVLNKIRDPDKRKASHNCLHRVWEACANMEKYVQLGFATEQRNQIFGKKNWGNFAKKNFDELCEVLGEEDNDETSELPLSQIISESDFLSEPAGDLPDDEPERFHAVINFPNFLLHVLRVVSGAEIPLDDKKLLTTFDEYLRTSKDAVATVKKFVFELLRCKYLFDQYVVKREFANGEDRWSLKRLKWIKTSNGRGEGRASYENTFGGDDGNTGYNRRILMLLSAFHVSTPTLVYKHWLSAALRYLYKASPLDANEYLKYLESVAKAFVFDRYLKPDGGMEYYQIIFENNGQCLSLRSDISVKDLECKLSFGQIENNLIFNYLDYLLWVKNENSQKKDRTISEYEFTFRSSVEHYYPQHPMHGHAALPPEILHSFGNLCLISHSKNSRLSNYMPAAKKDHYSNNTIDSIKQYLMMANFDTWTAENIREHSEDMKDVFLNSLQ